MRAERILVHLLLQKVEDCESTRGKRIIGRLLLQKVNYCVSGQKELNLGQRVDRCLIRERHRKMSVVCRTFQNSLDVLSSVFPFQ
jgi:hypothetical protein